MESGSTSGVTSRKSAITSADFVRVAVEVGHDRDRGGTQAELRLRHRHRRAHPEPACFVGRAGDDAAPFGRADDDRLPLQGRVVQDLHRRVVERVHVDVQDAAVPASSAPSAETMRFRSRRRVPWVHSHATATDTAGSRAPRATPMRVRRAPARARGRARHPPDPPIAFITAPMIAPAACTLPSRIFSSTSGCAASASSIAAMQRAVVRHDREPARSDDLRRRPSPRSRPRAPGGRAGRSASPVSTSCDSSDDLRPASRASRASAAARCAMRGQLARPPLARLCRRSTGGDRRLDLDEAAPR